MSDLPFALVLDDRPSRHRLIQKELGHQFRLVSSFDPLETLNLLLDPNFSFAFVTLDFVLGHPTMDGLSVVLELQEAAADPSTLQRLKTARWRVHSMDSQGGPEMVRVLRGFLGRDIVEDHFPLP